MRWANVAVMVGPAIGSESRRDSAPRDDGGEVRVDHRGCRCREGAGGFVTVCDCTTRGDVQRSDAGDPVTPRRRPTANEARREWIAAVRADADRSRVDTSTGAQDEPAVTPTKPVRRPTANEANAARIAAARKDSR